MTSSHEEFRDFTGAYALDALDETERAAFEDHLADCVDCQTEVRELRETVADLATTYETPAPAGAEARLMRAIASEQRGPSAPAKTPDASVTNLSVARQRRARVSTYLFAAAAVLLAVVLSIVGVNAYALHQSVSNMQHVMAVATSQDAHLMPLHIPSASSSIVVSMSENGAAFMATSLPMPASDHVYQVWSKSPDGSMTSVGMFVPSKDGHVSTMLTADLHTTTAFMVTIEPAGGSRQPSQPPIAEVRL